ncbi:MAG: hypothetical protein MJ176_03465 [Treponema sp.]|nr:hypothetical protein [Treponema sp.]
MSKEFDVYDPGKWIYGDEEEFLFLSSPIFNPDSKRNFTQSDIAILLNELAARKKTKFTNDQEFRGFVNKVLVELSDISMNELEKIENEKLGFVSPEMSGVIISGYELTKNQLNVFKNMKLTEDEKRIVVETYYYGRKNGLATYQIKQDLFMKIKNHDIDFLIDIMRAETKAEEKHVLQKYS